MLDFEDIAVLDKNASYLGVPTFTLMENAGAGVAKVINERPVPENGSIIIFCGLGNNGGDGLVAARYLALGEKYNVHLAILGKPSEIRTKIATEQYYKLPSNINVFNIDNDNEREIMENLNFDDFSFIVDAMLGVGITGTLREPYKSVVEKINSLKVGEEAPKHEIGENDDSPKSARGKPIVISVDVPTGLGTDLAVKPDITITFHDSKFGMTKDNSGEIIVHDIGIPSDAARFVGPGELTFIPKLKPNSHKGDHGRLLVIGGGPYTGAPALVGLSAYRTGVDLVHLAVPNTIYNIITGFSPNFIVHSLVKSSEYLVEADIENIMSILTTVQASAVVLGPGLGRAEETEMAVRKIINNIPNNIPIVIDADALHAIIQKDDLGDMLTLLRGHNGVLTPHHGEFKILTSAIDLEPNNDLSKNDLPLFVQQFANALGSDWIVTLKGDVDIISNGRETKLNRTGNPGMTVGGTGDVLAGVTGALLAKGLKPFNAACAGAFINGYSGDLAWEKFGNGLMATDIIEFIPKCLKDNLG